MENRRFAGAHRRRRGWRIGVPFSTALCLAFVLVWWGARPAQAEFAAGWAAYQRGEFATALEVWRPLADDGMAEAQYNLGIMYDEGKGVARDIAAAMAWWNKAADQGMAAAQHNLASAYIAGEGMPQDFGRALGWLERAAAQGLARSQYTLGKMYVYGMGVAEDEDQAAQWFLKASDQGYVRAQHNLGKLYRDGHGGLEQSYTEAVAWFRKAALQGYAKAQDHLATRYARGEGVGQDDVTALAWLNLAAEQSFTTAIENRKALLRRMSESEIADAKRLTEDLRRQIGG